VLRDAELLQLLLPLLRANLAVHETYKHVADEPLECPIFALGGYEQTREPFALHMFSGDHFFLRSEKALLWTMSQELVKVLPWARTAAKEHIHDKFGRPLANSSF
jgi:medium-chain acyl-[acyl-carrier-protein] hydrolase